MKLFRKWWSVFKLRWKIRKLRRRVDELYNMEDVPKVHLDFPYESPGWNARIVDLK